MNSKSWLATVALTTTLVISGCGMNNNEGAMDKDTADQFNAAGYNNGQGKNNGYNNQNNGRNGMDEMGDYGGTNRAENFNYTSTNNDNGKNDEFGFVRYTEDQVGKDEDEVRYGVMNREHVSDLITRMMLQGQGIKDAATLVTDSEALIAYTPNGEVDRNETATIAKKTAMSVLPRYYEVYVTDQDGAHKELANLSKMNNSNKNYKSILEQTISEMRKSPQGEKMYNDETKSMKDKRDVEDMGEDTENMGMNK
ncbi:YhcN/YlaJ family sporulation lipoprotein [Pontibacillus yanchengensis]|uniref:Sporulation protein n=1 Tax=Pontibacillus yanchengensis Y32 TaxID=1385514 RepID=A0A0A2TNB0_9BACI|nr:YhcN/YlaJ family sporulation lipoprotein [Pontibacillus yanchengensis]KGP70820.1 hypothetical protein N782_02780 [Pontibacillus yanchengensis Y32]